MMNAFLIHLGLFNTIDAASAAYRQAVRAHFGDFAPIA
jgi:hypothetical protein